MITSGTGEGKCVMRSSCGRLSGGSKDVPCPYDGLPVKLEDEGQRLLLEVCGPELAQSATCCDANQLNTLKENFGPVEALVSACPACINNFREFFCTFTCSPNQSTFLNITSTEKTTTGKTGVSSLDFFVEKGYGKGFFDSCKNVQVGGTNGYAMELIGGGAKEYTKFLKFLGDKKSLGSPFQIDFPLKEPPSGLSALNRTARDCADNDLTSRCTCIDCPNVCPTIPPVPPPNGLPSCHVGNLSCLSFILILTYCVAVVGFLIGYIVQTTIRRRRERTYERVALSEDAASPRLHTRTLVGAVSLAQNLEEDSLGTQSESRHLGRGASLLDPIETVQPRHYPLNNILRQFFYRLGLFAASSPWLTFASVFLVVGLLNIGWKKFEVETDPVRLWVAPTSESKLQKEFFDTNFGPFYRTEQIFVTNRRSTIEDIPNSDTTLSNQAITVGNKPPVLSWETLKYWVDIEAEIRELTSLNGYTLDDVCFKPSGPDGACVVQSAAAWFGNDLEGVNEETWAPYLQSCAESPVDCLPDFQQPLAPHYVLGGVPTNETTGLKEYWKAEALVITYVVSDSLDHEVQARAIEWEEELKNYLQSLSAQLEEGEPELYIAFSTGVSLEEEINKSTNTDVKIVVLSYLAMFFYVSLTLGNGSANREEDGVVSSLVEWARNFPKLFSRASLTASTLSIDSRTTPRFFPRLPRSLFVGSKFTLGLFGIILVILSVSTSVGLFSLLGVKVTLIIAEVIPFLVLAVGVDNVFILVHELDRQNFLHGPNAASHSYQGSGFSAPMSPTQSHRSPFDSTHDEIDAISMPLYLPAEERVARTLAKMGPSILLSTITETVAFALGALVPMPAVRNFALYAAGSVLLNAALQVTVFISALLLDLKRYEASRIDCFPCIRLPSRIALPDGQGNSTGLGKIGRFIRRYYAPFLLKPLVKGIVLAIFAGAFVISVISMQHIQLGLDQRLALPSDSYLVNYFDNLDAYLDIGPPVYFVATDVDLTKRDGQQALCGRFTTCKGTSVANRLEAERKRPETSFIAEPSASWVDDYLRWLNPTNDQCCLIRKNNPDMFCPRPNKRACKPCYEDKTPAWNISMDGLPEGQEFMRFFKHWLESPTNSDCPLAGQASFGSAVSLTEAGDNIVASHFRTFHSPLKNQNDFINAFAAAHRIADEISEDIGATVFPYSLFYVFFDQYAHIVAITQEILGLGLAAVLIVTALLLGSWRTGTIVTGVVALTVVTVMGVMSVWDISLNAISLVNLVISLGIAVEFCAHVARAFMSAGNGYTLNNSPQDQKDRDERMWTALVDVGPSVLSGITFTKLIGMSVLALTRSKLLEIYYFRMWLTLIISGALHGLVLLPVVLSLAGGPGFPQGDDEEWMSNTIRNEYEYPAFLADDDSITSD